MDLFFVMSKWENFRFTMHTKTILCSENCIYCVRKRIWLQSREKLKSFISGSNALKNVRTQSGVSSWSQMSLSSLHCSKTFRWGVRRTSQRTFTKKFLCKFSFVKQGQATLEESLVSLHSISNVYEWANILLILLHLDTSSFYQSLYMILKILAEVALKFPFLLKKWSNAASLYTILTYKREITWENWHVWVLEGLTKQSNYCDSTIISLIQMIFTLASMSYVFSMSYLRLFLQ